MAYTKTTWITGSTPLSANNMNHIEQGIKDAHDMIAAITETIFPVGSYYETSNSSFNPNGTFAGTWILEKAGQVHVSAGSGYAVSGALSNQSDGGNKDAIVPYHRHTIPALSGTAASTGAHTHTISASSASAGGHSHTANSNGSHTHTAQSAGAHTHTISSSLPHKVAMSDGTWSSEQIGGISGTTNRIAQILKANSFSYSNSVSSSCGSAGAHTHTTDSQGAHTHSTDTQGSHSHTITASSASAGAHTHTVTTSANNTGYEGVSGNLLNANMMPYINVYRWHRTA